MKLLRYGPRGQEKPGLLDAGGAIRDLSGAIADLTPETISPAGLARLAGLDAASLPQVPGAPRLGLPVAGTAKVLCVGLNYIDHANEVGAPIPKDAIYFQKPVTALTGPNDPIVKPVDSTMLDWEVELVVVMGSKAQYIGEGEVMDHIAGFALGNDVSEREFQSKRSGQWTKGKSHDSFAPIGPWLVTKDEVADVQNLDMFLNVNGRANADRQYRQDDLLGGRSGGLCQPLHDPDAGRCRHDRHAARRRQRHETAALSGYRRRGASRHRGPRRSPADGRLLGGPPAGSGRDPFRLKRQSDRPLRQARDRLSIRGSAATRDEGVPGARPPSFRSP